MSLQIIVLVRSCVILGYTDSGAGDAEVPKKVTGMEMTESFVRSGDGYRRARPHTPAT